MIAKINKTASLYGTLLYNQDKVIEGSARIISGNRMFSDSTGNPVNSMQQTLFAFEPYLAANRNTRKPVLHISLNPAEDDRLNEDQFANLAKNYMEKMNYSDQPYIVYIHEDINRRHIHIVSVAVDETGRKINDSYEHRRSMSACRELEITFGLKKITDVQQETDHLFLRKVDYGKGNVKRQIANILISASDYRFRTFGEYSALLSCFNIEAKLVRGEGVDGKPFNGIVYSATDDTCKTTGNPFKSSLFGKTYGYEGLNKRMEKHAKDFKDGKYAPMIRSAIANAMKTTRDRTVLVSLLREKGIETIFRINDTGRLYGVTFIDLQRKEVYNGSTLGKEFSANVFNRLFDVKPHETQSKTNSTGELPKDSHGNEISFPIPHDRETALEQIFGFFDYIPAYDNSDYEEKAFLRQMKRRKKKKQRVING